ncbi:MAG: hypothetical protein ABSA57_17595 [Candidatus Acidiferrales bacterium]
MRSRPGPCFAARLLEGRGDIDPFSAAEAAPLNSDLACQLLTVRAAMPGSSALIAGITT